MSMSMSMRDESDERGFKVHLILRAVPKYTPLYSPKFQNTHPKSSLSLSFMLYAPLRSGLP